MSGDLESWNPSPKILEYLINDLKHNNPELNRKCLFIGGESYTANEIMEGLKSGNDLGRTFYEMSLRIRDC